LFPGGGGRGFGEVDYYAFRRGRFRSRRGRWSSILSLGQRGYMGGARTSRSGFWVSGDGHDRSDSGLDSVSYQFSEEQLSLLLEVMGSGQVIAPQSVEGVKMGGVGYELPD
jgi:hypothetical protein